MADGKLGDVKIEIEGLLPEVAKELEGKTFKEAWESVRFNYRIITNKMQRKFGDRIWTPDKDRYFSDVEKEWLQLGQGLVRFKEENKK